jgi:hypothetical protein
MLNKRILLFVLWSVMMVAGCGGTVATENDTAAVVDASSATAVQILVAANDFEVGTPRVPIIFFDGPNMTAAVQAVQLTAYDTSQEPPTAGWEGTAVNYSDYKVPYWVFYPELPHAGVWGFRTFVTLEDGTQEEQLFSIQVEAQNSAPLVGDLAIPSENRTLFTEPEIAKLSSGSDPNPAFYQQTVAEALTTKRPTVISFSTPAFCQTAICAPVLSSVEAVYDEFGTQANFIHLEIYKEFNPLVTADEVTEWNLPSEPWTFVIDADGVIRGRLGGPVSPRELTAVLEPLLN